jgi:DeoR/GlpR family transcriptional regulator of sugar metabolism
MTHKMLRFNWFDVVPENIAAAQIAWERRQSIVRAIESGATVQEIAIRQKVTVQTIYRLRQLQHCWHQHSPAERYLKGVTSPTKRPKRNHRKLSPAESRQYLRDAIDCLIGGPSA